MWQHKDVAMETLMETIVFWLLGSLVSMLDWTLEHLPSHIFVWYVLVCALSSTFM
jgi:hypothetical protein